MTTCAYCGIRCPRGSWFRYCSDRCADADAVLVAEEALAAEHAEQEHLEQEEEHQETLDEEDT
jgi:endogenous inhibitor of DNA gyrase (YacG/DUF329 family)